MAEITVRRYRKEDRLYVRDLAWDTALMGEPASAFFSDKEILADFLTLYFTDYEPESCFVAESNNRVIGYLMGAKDITTLNKVSREKIAPRLVAKALINGIFLKKKNLAFFLRLLLSFCKGELKMPDFSRVYPATLHINLQKEFRSLGIGSKLIGSYLEYLSGRGIAGVYLPTMSDKAAGFFRKIGFNLLYRGRRSYFRHILQRDVPLYIYGKKLQ